MPVSEGSIFSRLTPKKRCKPARHRVGDRLPEQVGAPSCWKLCDWPVWLTESVGSVGARPVASSATISENCSGGSER